MLSVFDRIGQGINRIGQRISASAEADSQLSFGDRASQAVDRTIEGTKTAFKGLGSGLSGVTVGAAGGLIRAVGEELASDAPNPLLRAMAAFPSKADAEGIAQLGIDATEMDARVQKFLQPPPELQLDPFEHPEVLADPRWWVHVGSSGVGSMIPFVATGMATAGVAGAVGGIVARTAPAVVGGITEGLVNGSLAYEEARQRGMEPEAAADQAAKIGAATAATSAVAGKLGVFGKGGGVARRAGVSAAAEGIEEGGQEVVTDLIQGDPISPGGVFTSAVGGAIAGGGASVVTGRRGAGESSTSETQAPIEGPPLTDTGPQADIRQQAFRDMTAKLAKRGQDDVAHAAEGFGKGLESSLFTKSERADVRAAIQRVKERHKSAQDKRVRLARPEKPTVPETGERQGFDPLPADLEVLAIKLGLDPESPIAMSDRMALRELKTELDAGSKPRLRDPRAKNVQRTVHPDPQVDVPVEKQAAPTSAERDKLRPPAVVPESKETQTDVSVNQAPQISPTGSEAAAQDPNLVEPGVRLGAPVRKPAPRGRLGGGTGVVQPEAGAGKASRPTLRDPLAAAERDQPGESGVEPSGSLVSGSDGVGGGAGVEKPKEILTGLRKFLADEQGGIEFDVDPPPGKGFEFGRVTGETNPPRKPRPTATAERPRPTINIADVNPDDFFNFSKINVSPEEEDALRALVRERAADKFAPKEPVPFSRIQAEARALHPSVVADLKAPKIGETMRPEVRFAARERVNALNDKALKEAKKLERDRLNLTPDEILQRSGEIERIERDAKALIDILIPTRSQDGRNLVYHKMMAEKSFDSEFWIGRARRKAGGALDPQVESAMQAALAEARVAEAAGDANGVEVARRKLSELFTKAEQTSLLDIISALRKAGLLTGIKTQVRNLGGNTAFAVMREASRIPGSVVDIAASLFTSRRTLTGASLSAVTEAGREAATRGVREAGEIMKFGATAKQLERFDMQRELNSGSKLLDVYVNRVFRVMAASDRPFRAFAYRRALEGRARAVALTEVRQGQLARKALDARVKQMVTEPPETLVAEAIADAEVAVFAENTSLTSAISGFRRRLGPGGRFIVDLFAPFVRTPTNIVTQLLEFSGVRGSSRAVKAAASSIVNRSMTAEQQKTIAEAVGSGMVGQALIMLGWFLAAGGFGDEDEPLATGVSSSNPAQRAIDEAAGRLPGAILVNGRWRQVSTFSPLGNLFTIGATLQREVSRGDGDANTAANVAAIAARTVLDQPFLTGTQDAIQVLDDPSSRGQAVLGRMIGSFVPTIFADVARLGDPVRRTTRKQGLLGPATERMPVLRKSLPERVDVLGQVQASEKRTAVDPTIAVPDKTKNRPGLKEMVRLGVGVGYVNTLKANKSRAEDETDPETQARGKLTGRLIETSVEALVQSAVYRALDDDSKRLAIEKAIGTARRSVNTITRDEGFQKLAPGARVAVLESMSARQPER